MDIKIFSIIIFISIWVFKTMLLNRFKQIRDNGLETISERYAYEVMVEQGLKIRKIIKD